MKKEFVGFVALVCAIAAPWLSTVPAFADCGKMVIIVQKWPQPPRPPKPPILVCPPTFPIHPQGGYTVPVYGQTQQQQQEQNQALNNSNKNESNVVINNNIGSVSPPPPMQGGAMAYGKTFMEGAQQAVIAWNGFSDDRGEETLILTTNEVSATGVPMAMLSVLPLPGKPISVERANTDVFVKSKILLDKKLTEKIGSSGGVGSFGAILTTKIGSHNIFVWEMEDINQFKEEVTAYVAEKYNNEATVAISEDALKVVKAYHAKGFRYFAFDLTLVSDKPSTKTAIAYRFKSTFGYYPLAISAIGGTGYGLIDLIVMTPDAVNLRGAFEPGKEQAPVIVKGKTSVDISIAELQELDPKLADVYKANGISSVKGRNFLITAEDIAQFTDDFICTAVPK